MNSTDSCPQSTQRTFERSRRPTLCRRFLLALSAFTVTGTAIAIDAEYAFRWDAKAGGPANAMAALGVLGITGKEPKSYTVQYFSVTTPIHLPAGYMAIGRERTTAGEPTESTFKIRGPEPMPAAMSKWTCPLSGQAETKLELDVTVLGPTQLNRSISWSCSVHAEALRPSHSASSSGCINPMTRIKAKSLKAAVKVEEWTLHDGSSVVEVSMEGQDEVSDLTLFRAEVVDLLTAGGAVPLMQSKTELGSQC